MSDEDVPLTLISDTTPCIGCGLCCDGTIYDKARAEPHERERMTALGLTLLEANGKDYFEHPCRFASEGRCTIYDERFTICHTFRCKLLIGYQAGEIGREEALDKVQQALELRSAVAAENPAAVRSAERRRLASETDGSNSPRLLLNMAALDHYLNSWFRKSKPQAAQAETAETADGLQSG